MTKRARAFENTTDTPCPRCMRLSWSGDISPDFVMPMPKFPALSRDGSGQKCCSDCAAADALMGFVSGMDFTMARIAIGNDRREGLRMPKGMMECFGTCYQGITKPASIEDLEDHTEFLRKNHLWPRSQENER